MITGCGRHLWFEYTGPIPSTAGRIAPGIDTRGDGGFVIVPPSIHPFGRRYEWASSAELSSAPKWLLDLARKRPLPTIAERALTGMKRPNGQPSAYGMAALDAEVEALADAPPGARNNSLNLSAFRLFQLVAGGELDRDNVIERLIDACHRNGLIDDDGFCSVMATIRGAMAGLKFPRGRGARLA